MAAESDLLIDFRNDLENYEAQMLRWKKTIRKTSNVLDRIPNDLQVPTKEINIVEKAVRRIVESINAVNYKLGEVDKEEIGSPSWVNGINISLKGISGQARAFNNIIKKINPRELARDSHRAGEEEEEGLTNIGDAIKDALTTAFEKVKDTFTGLFAQVTKAFSELGDKLEDIGKKIKEFILSMGEDIKSGFNEFWGYLKPVLEAIWTFIQWVWDLAATLVEYNVWFWTTLVANTYKTILVAPFLFFGLYYISKAILIYLTGAPDDVMVALGIAVMFHFYMVTYQLDTLLDLQDYFLEFLLRVFLNPLGRSVLGISTSDRVYTDFQTFTNSSVSVSANPNSGINLSSGASIRNYASNFRLSGRSKLILEIFTQLLAKLKTNFVAALGYLLLVTIIAKFLVVDVTLQAFRLSVKDVFSFGTLIQV